MALKVQAAITAWRELDLIKVQRELDEEATDLTSRQDESETSRKKLVELSREFKKNSDEEARRLVSPLLKSFQAEVDSLSRRSKAAEVAFLSVYKKVIDLTDPLPTLEYCAGLERKVGRLADLEIENRNLRETLEEYNKEFKEVRHQEVTVKMLREKVRHFEENGEEAVRERVREMEKELAKQYSEKEQLLEETQESTNRRLIEAEARVHMLQTSLEQTQSELFELRSSNDEVHLAKSDETELLLEEAERANQRAAAAEKAVVLLNERLEAATAASRIYAEGVNASDTAADNSFVDLEVLARSSLEVELTAKEKEVSQLVEEIKRLQKTLKEVRESAAHGITSLEEKLHSQSTQMLDLQERLGRQTDYEDVKRELQMMKAVEFGWGDEIEGRAGDLAALHHKPLEVLLLEKSKTLQSENTALRIANGDLNSRLTEAERELQQLQMLTQEQRSLVCHLESDLSSVQAFSSMYRGEGEGASVPEAVMDAARSATVNSFSPSSINKAYAKPFTIEGEGAPSDFASAAESLLPIVSAQRERFRQRNEELETEVTAKSQQVVLLQNELDSLRTDNLKLYEKIRFLQSYRSQHGETIDASSPAESRYSSQYEEALDPFASFSRQERTRKYAALSPFERLTLSTGRLVLGNRTARSVALAYTAMVHCLIFLVLYKLAHTESCKRDFASDCAQKFAEHMQNAHGHSDGGGETHGHGFHG